LQREANKTMVNIALPLEIKEVVDRRDVVSKYPASKVINFPMG